MPGAALQSAGQVRYALPYIARRTYQLTASNFGSSTIVDIPNTELLPFGRTADRSGRAFYVINNVSYLIVSDDYTGTGGNIAGFCFLEVSGIRYTLFAFSYQVTGPKSENIQRGLIPEVSVMTDQTISLGKITFDMQGQDNGTTASISTMYINLDIGFYGDYEIDNPHCHECEREIIAARAIPLHEG